MNEGLPTLSRILFIDIVGFSKKPSHNQKILIQKLTGLVQQTKALNSLKKKCRVELPTGDGIALALWGPPELPLLAAIELAELIKKYNSQCPPSLTIEIRTGINSGEVFTVTDINEQRNIVGEGINNTQRVMDFGDAGHIMASKNLVEEILDVAPKYAALLHDAGIFSDKHGVLHHLYNVFDWKTGNAKTPARNRAKEQTKPTRHLWQSLYELAVWETNFLRHPLMESAHIFLALTKLDNSRTQQAIIALNEDPTKIRRNIRKAMGKGNTTSTREVIFSESLQQNLGTAWQYAAEAARDIIEEDFIQSILNGTDKQSVHKLLQSAGIAPDALLSCFAAADGFASCIESALPVQLPPEVIPSTNSALPRHSSISNDADKAITDIHQAMTQPLSESVASINMNVTLLVENGPQKGRRFEFREPELFIVGRSPDANFVLDRSDPCVSRKHFMVEIVPPRCYLKDFGSLNGTLVNNEKCRQAELHDGDLISAGKTNFVVRISCNTVGSGLSCSRCGNLFHVTSSNESQTEAICSTCKSEQELEKLGKFAKTKVPVKAYCCECRADVGKYAASDGKGLLLSDVARYLCKDCYGKKPVTSTQIGQYHLLQQLGQGGMGSVFLAWDAATCRLGALKRILLPEPDTKVARRFIREMKIMAEFSHPHLVRIYEDGVHEGAPYFFSEYLDGGSLTRYMNQNGGKLSSRTALQITCDILSGLEFFHESGHIHRDIKPSNILLNNTDNNMLPTAKIADFGLAKSFVGVGGTKLTKANEFAGSLYYTPPEQIVNFSRVGPTADIYSAGVTLYQILTGMLPYNFQSKSSANSMKDSLLVVLEEPIIPIKERNTTIPAALAAIVEKAIAKKAEDRFATAGIFKAELQKYLETLV